MQLATAGYYYYYCVNSFCHLVFQRWRRVLKFPVRLHPMLLARHELQQERSVASSRGREQPRIPQEKQRGGACERPREARVAVNGRQRSHRGEREDEYERQRTCARGAELGALYGRW